MSECICLQKKDHSMLLFKMFLKYASLFLCNSFPCKAFHIIGNLRKITSKLSAVNIETSYISKVCCIFIIFCFQPPYLLFIVFFSVNHIKIQLAWQNVVNCIFSEATASWIDYRHYLSVVVFCASTFSVVRR